MARFVLIHGAWQGAWCWRDVLPRLAAHGHDAVAIDLPAHGADTARPQEVTFQQYVERALQEAGAAEPPILAGHSMGGTVAAQAAEAAPHRVRAAVCVASPVPSSGASMLSVINGLDPEFQASLEWAPDGRSARINPEGVRRLWCPDSPSIADSMLPLLTEEPVAPHETPLFWSSTPTVPRYYIECLRDRMVPIALQRSMRQAVTFTEVFALDAGHDACLSMPNELASLLNRIAARG